MPSHVPRSVEPYRKDQLMAKRVAGLRAVIRDGAMPDRLARAAEKVRAAALAVIKARRSIIASHPASLTGFAGHPEGEGLLRQLANLEAEAARWTTMAVEEIASLYPPDGHPQAQG